MFVTWPLACGAVLKGCGTLRSWSLAGGSGPLGPRLPVYSLLPGCGCKVTICAPRALLLSLPSYDAFVSLLKP